MTADVSVLAALFAGLISFLSPCVLPLVPPYLVYLAGSSLERLAEAEPAPLVKRDVLVAALLFVAGFSTVFVALGAAVSSISVGLRGLQAVLAGWLADMKLALASATGWDVPISDDPFAIIAGLIIIIMGLHFLGITPIAFLYRQARLDLQKPVGLWGAYVMGLAFALGWTPCIGPILATILAVAGSQSTVAKGTGLLAVYSLGLGVPFMIAALAVEPFAAFLARFRAYLPYVEKGMGAFLVLTGVVFLFGVFTLLNTWMIETFPALQRIG
jgi:cytochrome c-type biogenesis protein